MSERVRHIVRGIVRAALATSSLAGCSKLDEASAPAGSADAGVADGGPVDQGDVTAFADEATFACEAPLADILTNLTPKTPIDYIELRTQRIDRTQVPAQLTPPTRSASAGTACKTATDPTRCANALADATLPDDPDSVDAGWIPGGNPSYKKPPNNPSNCCIDERAFLVVTAGDTVTMLVSTEDVARVLAPIDTLEEARLLASTRTMLLDCSPGTYRAGWKRNDDGSWELLVTYDACASHDRRRVHVSVDGKVSVVAHEYRTFAICGRRPAGLVPAHESRGSEIASFVASSAHLEAASVLAFRRLERELVSYGAPSELVRRARRARHDEIRHARNMGLLARELGADVPPVETSDVGVRDLLAVAVENAVEGCTFETYGAAVAVFQAERAAPERRPLFREIARDEIRHAALAHDVAAWLDGKLTTEERMVVAKERVAALETLRGRLDVEPPQEIVAELGIPTRAEAVSMFTALKNEL